MNHTQIDPFNPDLDLRLERIVDIRPEKVWAAWTTPEHLMKWFTPAPWTTIACEMDLRPGGKFTTTMCSPEGQEFPNAGCYLEIVPNQRLVWTNCLQAGFRPSGGSMDPLPFTAIISLEPHGEGTRYVATCLHRDPEDRKKHDEMGFYVGWSIVLDQLVALMKGE